MVSDRAAKQTDAGPTEAMPTDIGSMTVASSSIAGLTLASRATGFIRGAVIAAVLGPTFFGNLFIVTNSLPNLIYEFAVGSLLVSMLVPHLLRLLDEGEPKRAKDTANGILGLLCLVFLGIALVLVAAGPVVLRVLGAGINDPLQLAEQRRVGWPLLALVIPQAVLYAVVGISAAVQNAHGRFALTAAAPIAENVITIVVFLAFGFRWGIGIDLVDVTTEQLLFLGVGATSAVGLHAAVQWWGAWRVGHVLLPSAGWRNPEVRSMLTLAIRSFGFASLNSLRYVIVLIAAGAVPGGVVAYQLALNFRDLPNALITRPFSTTSLPALSRHANRRDWPAFLQIYRSTLRLTAFLEMLATVGLVVLSVQITRALAFGSMNSDIGRTLLVAALATMPLGIVGDGVFVMATNASYAMRDAGRPLRVMALRTAITGVGVAISLSLDGTATLVALGLGVAVADNAAGFLLHRRLLSGIDAPPSRELVRPGIKILISGLVAGAAGALTSTILDPGPEAARALNLLVLGVGVVNVIVVYFGTAALLGLTDLADLGRSLRRSPQTSTPTDAPRPDKNPVSQRVVGFVRTRSFIVPAAFITAILASIVIGLAAAVLDVYLVLATVGLAIILAVAVRPALAAYLWLGTAPLVVGIDRGTVVPMLRVNEALLVLLVGGVVLRAAVAPRGRFHVTTADASVVGVAIAGSVVPLLVLVSRNGAFTFEELLFTLPLIKLAVLYAMIRASIRAASEARVALQLILASASLAAIIGFFQTLGLLGVRGFLSSGLYASGPSAEASVSAGRGTSTIGNAIGAAGLYTGCLLITLVWARRPDAPRRFLAISGIALLIGLAGTAQFSAVVGLVAGLVALRFLNGQTSVGPTDAQPQHARSPVALGALVVLAGVSGAMAFGPRVAGLLQGDLPQSWVERWHNLSTHFLSEIGLNTNLLIGVSPVTQVRDPRGFVEWIWIESGYIELLYAGGIILLGAFAWLIQAQLSAAWATRVRNDVFGVISAATWITGVAILVLMLLDPHLTIRGTADLFFPLMAMAMTGYTFAPVFERRSSSPISSLALGGAL